VNRTPGRCVARVLLVLLFFAASRAQAQLRLQNSLDAIARGTVVLSSRLDAKTQSSGFGLIVGDVDGVMLIATANHLLRQRGRAAPPVSIEVHYEFSPGAPFQARALDVYDEELDIGFVAAASPGGIDVKSVAPPSDCLAYGDTRAFGFVGSHGELRTSALRGRLGLAQPRKIEIVGLASAERGSSGAPAVTRDGVLGLIISGTGSSTAATTVTPISAVRQLIDDKLFFQDGREASREWHKNENESLECENCRGRTSGYCAAYSGEKCESLRLRGFPTNARVSRVRWNLPTSCQCVEARNPASRNRPSSKFSKEDRRTLECTSLPLVEVVAGELRRGSSIATWGMKFAPVRSEIAGLFATEQVEPILTASAREQKRLRTNHIDGQVEALPHCMYVPRGLRRQFHRYQLRVVRPAALCELDIFAGDDSRRSAKIRYFAVIDARVVLLHDFENW
jgi:hypothetical protein